MIREDRTKYRKDIVNVKGSRELRKLFSVTCQKRPNPKTHSTCVGCLCPCHDGKGGE